MVTVKGPSLRTTLVVVVTATVLSLTFNALSIGSRWNDDSSQDGHWASSLSSDDGNRDACNANGLVSLPSSHDLSYSRHLYPWDQTRVLWIFVHIPKTGGTRLRHALTYLFPDRRICMDYPDTQAHHRFVDRSPHEQDKCDIVVGHFSHGVHMHPNFPPRPVRYFTVLRQPDRRTYSLYHMFLSFEEQVKDPASGLDWIYWWDDQPWLEHYRPKGRGFWQWLRNLYSHVPKNPGKRMNETVDDRPRLPCNWQTFQLSRQFDADSWANVPPHTFADGSRTPRPPEPPSWEDLEIAKRNIDRMAVTMFTEDLNHALLLIQQELGWDSPYLSFHAETVGGTVESLAQKGKSTSDQFIDSDEAKAHADILEESRQRCNYLDWELYAHARKTYALRVLEVPGAITTRNFQLAELEETK